METVPQCSFNLHCTFMSKDEVFLACSYLVPIFSTRLLFFSYWFVGVLYILGKLTFYDMSCRYTSWFVIVYLLWVVLTIFFKILNKSDLSIFCFFTSFYVTLRKVLSIPINILLFLMLSLWFIFLHLNLWPIWNSTWCNICRNGFH